MPPNSSRFQRASTPHPKASIETEATDDVRSTRLVSATNGHNPVMWDRGSQLRGCQVSSIRSLVLPLDLIRFTGAD
jgi:hypothetical protein